MGPRAGLHGYEKSRPRPGLDPGPSSPKRVAIPTQLSTIQAPSATCSCVNFLNAGVFLFSENQKVQEKYVNKKYNFHKQLPFNSRFVPIFF